MEKGSLHVMAASQQEFTVNDTEAAKDFRVEETKKIEKDKNPKLFMGGPKRLNWPPSEPQYGNVDRRPNIEEARKNEDFHKSFEELVKEQDLDFECHNRVNRLGYHQNIFRISGGAVAKTKGAVFLQHGLFASADSWVIHKEKSLAI